MISLAPLPAGTTPAAGIHPALARVLAVRGISEEVAVQDFLHPRAGGAVPDRLREVSARLERAVERGERIFVVADYDADGMCSLALFLDYLYARQAAVRYFFPDRMLDGYGLSERAVELAARWQAQLLVTLDCALTGREPYAIARQAGMEVLAIDHHPMDTAVRPDFLLNPHEADWGIPYRELTTTGWVGELLRLWNAADDFTLGLTAISIASDQAPLIGHNRYPAREGLAALYRSKRAGLRVLLGHCPPLREFADIARHLAPLLNAAGRMASADTALQALLAAEAPLARRLAGQLIQHNDRRRTADQKVLREALAALSKAGEAPIAVAWQATWLPGVLGIAASRACARLGKPVLLLARTPRGWVGSGRAPAGFDLLSALSPVHPLLESLGGHAPAVGFSLSENQLPAFLAGVANLQPVFLPETIPVAEADLSFGEITGDFLSQLAWLAPFGRSHAPPLFRSEPAELCSVDSGAGEQLTLKLRDSRGIFQTGYYSPGAAEWDWIRPGKWVQGLFSIASDGKLAFSRLILSSPL